MVFQKQTKIFFVFFLGCCLMAWIMDYNSLFNRIDRDIEEFEKTRLKDKALRAELLEYRVSGEKKRRAQNMIISTAFKDGRCEDFFDQIPPILNNSLLKADLHMRGKCQKKNFEKAAALYQKNISEIGDMDNNPPDSLFHQDYDYIAHNKFRLAALLWRGQGITQDREKASKLINDAAIFLGPYLFERRHDKSLSSLKDRPNIWDMTETDLIENAALTFTGPWNRPELMIEKIDWLRNLEKQGGQAIFDVGLHLLHGTGGYKKDPTLGYEWIYMASEIHNHPAAHYERAILLYNERFHALKRTSPISSFDHHFSYKTEKGDPKIRYLTKMKAYDLLLLAVKAGDMRADKKILALHKQAPDYEYKNEDIYFWMLRLQQKDKKAISETELAELQNKLERYQKNSVEEDILKGSFPSTILYDATIMEQTE